MQEMKEKGMATSSQLEKDSQLDHSWSVYSLAERGYLKARLIEEALTMLRKLEEIIGI